MGIKGFSKPNPDITLVKIPNTCNIGATRSVGFLYKILDIKIIAPTRK